jgi:predicted metalloendopeptidase
MGIADRSAINVGQPEFIKAVNGMMTTVPVADWRTYLRWHVVHQSSDFLSSPFVNENFAFYGKTLNGTLEMRPRWKRGRDFVDGSIGEALGQLYVARTFTRRRSSARSRWSRTCARNCAIASPTSTG